MSSTKKTDLFPEDGKISETENFMFGSHLYIRQECVQFDEILQKLGCDSTVRYVHLYCDVLTSGDRGLFTLNLPRNVLTLHIFAREFLPSMSNFNCEITEDQTVFIYYDQAAGGHQLVKSLLFQTNATSNGIGVSQATQTSPYAITNNDGTITAAKDIAFEKGHVFEMGSLGVKIYQKKRSSFIIISTISNVPLIELEGPPLALIQAFPSDHRKTSTLSNLLYKIFESASAKIFNDSQKTATLISKLRFIIQCACLSPSHANITADAQKLLERIETTSIYPGLSADSETVYYVPRLETNVYLEGLKERVRDVIAIEKQLLGSDEKIAKEASFKEAFGTMMKEMGNNTVGFINSEANRQRALEAIGNCKRQRDVMESYVKATNSAADKFKNGVKHYQKLKMEQFEREMLIMGAELLASIVLAVATCGAGAQQTLDILKKTGDGIKKGRTVMGKVWRALKKIWETIKKLTPKLYDAFKRQEVYNKSMLQLKHGHGKSNDGSGKGKSVDGALRDVAESITKSTMPEDVTARIDYLGIQADWKEFDQMVDSMFKELKEAIGNDTITGMCQFKLSLKGQVIRGITVIHAMQEVQEAMQFYHRQEVEVMARKKRRQELLGIAEKSKEQSDQSAAWEALRWNMIQEGISLKTTLFVRFHECLLSLIYKSNDPQRVKRLLESYPIQSTSSAKDFETFLNQIEEVNRNVTSKKNTIGTPIPVSTNENHSMFSHDWKHTLQTERRIAFNIRHNELERTSSWHHVRIKEVMAEFKGLEVKGTNIEWDWEFGPQCVDKDVAGQPISYYMPVQPLRQVGGEGRWEDDMHQLPDPSLFCRGQIVFRRPRRVSTHANSSVEDDGEVVPGFSPAKAQELDLSGVTEVILKFKCEGLPLDA